MAFDDRLARRARALLLDDTGVVEKKMFGGVAFLLHGHMACGLLRDDLIVRLSTDQALDALDRPHVRVFDLTGRPMRGWVMVGPEATARDEDLQEWVRAGLDFARSLPPKG